MKKVIKFIVPFLVASSAIFSGCKKKEYKDDKILLSFGDVHSEGYKEITIQKLNELVKAKESFLLVVSTNTCGCWNEFSPNLNKYLKENKAICYKVDFNQIKDVASAYDLNLLSSSTTTFAIFENGKLTTTLNSSEDGNIMYDEKKFSQYMSEKVRLPGCYFVNKDDFYAIKESGKNAVIYFERSECSDCTKLNPSILREYINKHSNINKIYVFDFQPYWKRSEDKDFKSYVQLKDELGLNEFTLDEEGNQIPSTINPTYGYGTGVFPYFSYIENGSFKSGAVIYNDKITKQDNKYLISNSYYTSERVSKLDYTNTVLLDKELSADDVNESAYGVTWKDESMNKIYGEILTSFLDYTLPKVTFTF